MSNGFIERKPWAAAAVALILGPIVGMCYLSRGRFALAYLALGIGLLAAVAAAIWHGLLNIDHESYSITLLLFLLLQIIGAVHSGVIARKRSGSEPCKWYGRWFALPVIFFAPYLFALLFRIFCYEPFHFPSQSMIPTIKEGDYLFVEKFAYSTHAPKRGDVIAFKIPANGQTYLKRIIGLPGEKVQIKAGVPYVNDVPFTHKANGFRITYEDTPEGKEYSITMGNEQSPFNNTAVFTVPEHQYFVVGDNRLNLMDSRFPELFYPVSENDIKGKAVEVIFNYSDGKLDPRPIN